jgi:hypothetical protein
MASNKSAYVVLEIAEPSQTRNPLGAVEPAYMQIFPISILDSSAYDIVDNSIRLHVVVGVSGTYRSSD